jgi:hypothetical protein
MAANLLDRPGCWKEHEADFSTASNKRPASRRLKAKPIKCTQLVFCTNWKRPINLLEYQRADGKTLAQLIIQERECALLK